MHVMRPQAPKLLRNTVMVHGKIMPYSLWVAKEDDRNKFTKITVLKRKEGHVYSCINDRR